MKEGLIFALVFNAPLNRYTSVYNMEYLASLVNYLVLRVENIQLESSNNMRTDHYTPINGGSSSVDDCVQTTIQSGVPRNKIILSAQAYSVRFILELTAGTSNNTIGLDERTTGGIVNRFSYTEVGC
jgi:hypothetical protein